MPPYGIGNDLGEGITGGGQQLRTHAQVHVTLLAHGIDDAVSFTRVGCGKYQGVGGLIAFHVDEPENVAAFHDFDPVIARRYDFSVAGSSRHGASSVAA